MVESKTPANPLFLRDEELRQGIELMFYAYRDFTFESDQQLKRYQLGRAHHRALYFIGRHPGHTDHHPEGIRTRDATQSAANGAELAVGEVKSVQGSRSTHGPQRDHEKYCGTRTDHRPDSLR